LVLAGPAMLVIALVIKITSRGPAIYTQSRVGIDRRGAGDSGNHRRRQDLGGRPFTIYKFRTMRASPAAAEAQVWARPDDPRVTTVGRFLRKYRLDELPQLFNVLRGDMNIVGPRPEQPRIFQRLRTEIDGYHQRQRVLPGITGWAQINQHYDASVEDVKRKVAYDLEYIARCSAIEDFRIMLRTLPVIAFKKGAW
jgi:lipopolysaccharide/colanic/teichoic acid biosynthesis glycosyltransferase